MEHLEKWTDASWKKLHDDLRDRDRWLKEYNKGGQYVYEWPNYYSGVSWIVRVGAMASFSFTRATSRIGSDNINKAHGPFEHVIKVDLKPTQTAAEAQGRGITSIKYQLTLAVAKELRLLNQEYNRIKEKNDQLQYYTYGINKHEVPDLEFYVRTAISSLVAKQLSAKKYLLVVDNLQWPIDLSTLTRDCGLPPHFWAGSNWLISPSSRDAYDNTKSKDDGSIYIEYDEKVGSLTIFALRQSAEHIFNTDCQESIEYWHDIALDCFHYAMAIFAGHSQGPAVTSDDLIHQWAMLLPCMTSSSSSSSKCSCMHRVGRVILEAFQKYSLLELPFSPAHDPREATNTGAQFLAHHGLIAESITVDELFDNKKKWISFASDHGYHVSRDWLSPKETNGTTALILRGCSQQSLIFSRLGHLLPKLCFLRVLDLSYTPLKSLPSSIGCLLNLRLLSVRGCHDLRTLFISSTESNTSPLSTLYQLQILDLNGVPFSHLTQDISNQKTNLINLDMSYSEMTTFPPNFFQDMSNLEELILVNCSNLVDLPASMVALSSLTTLEITKTRIKYFPHKIFEEMQKLQFLKLIDNSNLISLTRPISRVHEIKLEGHPNLKAFSLIGAPHIRHISLRGCRKLESIEFKNLGALEDLDLSSTAIKEVPAGIPNGTQLRRLLLLGVPSLLRFPWHMLERLPRVFCLDQCEGDVNQFDQVAHVCVSDSMFFYSFGNSCEHLVREGRFFQSFYVRVTPCSTNIRERQHAEGMVDNMLREKVRKQSTYMDVYITSYAKGITIASPITVHQTERHVEITGMQRPPHGLYNLLNVTKSLSVTRDTSIKYLTGWGGLDDLEECELLWCHKMEIVFIYNWHMKNIRNLQACNLKSLVWLCSSNAAFSSLEHLHLDNCPRLEGLMQYSVRQYSVTLPCLKTLDILFCYNLKKIFGQIDHHCGTYQLPNLQRVRLQELPLLQQFHNKDATLAAPMWKELHIRGCWSLQLLPHLKDQPKKLKVNGERSWWSKLQWGSPSHRDSYEPRLPPKFASFDVRTEVTSYLR